MDAARAQVWLSSNSCHQLHWPPPVPPPSVELVGSAAAARIVFTAVLVLVWLEMQAQVRAMGRQWVMYAVEPVIHPVGYQGRVTRRGVFLMVVLWAGGGRKALPQEAGAETTVERGSCPHGVAPMAVGALFSRTEGVCGRARFRGLTRCKRC